MTGATARRGPWRALALAALLCACACDRARPPNVLLITLDTTRADRLGAYGYLHDTSPNFDALARRGVLFRNAHSTSSWTLPAHASLFTGKLPSSHGARYDPQGPLLLDRAIEIETGIRARGLQPGERTLAAVLREAGYATAGFAGGPWLARVFGLAEGFEHWDDEGITDGNGRPAGLLAQRAIAWLESHLRDEADRPFFVFVNFFDAHFPFRPPARHARRFLAKGTRIDPLDRRQFGALYDGEIRYADEHLGVLLDFLEQRGVYDRTLIVVTADHGEMLGDHGAWGHNGLLFEPLVRIPLVVKPPGPPEPRVDETPVQIGAVFHWILEAAGVAVPGPAPPLLAEVWHPPAPEVGAWTVLWEGPLKYMHHAEGQHRLYDLSQDPGERTNLLERRPADAQRLEAQLTTILAAQPRPAPAGPAQAIDPETRKALERLGYLDRP